ncbi:MAG: hypothetical protein ACREHD_31540, partial [Pirellulales bacterium]
ANTPLTTLTVNWPDITNVGTLSLADDGQGILPEFEHLAASTVITAAQNVADDFVANMASKTIAHVANVNLPLANKTLTDLLNTQDSFQKQLSQLANGTIDQIVGDLEQLLGGTATLSFDTGGLSTAVPEFLKFHFTYSPAALNEHTALDLDLKALSSLVSGLNLPAGISSLAEMGGQADLALSASAALSVDMGIDLTTPTLPRPFLYGTTNLVVDALASATNVNFQAALGGILGLFVDNGTAYLGAQGSSATAPQPAEFKLAFQDTTARYYFDTLGSFAFTPSLNGQLNVDLPLDFPTKGTPLDPNQRDLTVSIPDLQAGLSGTANSIAIATPTVSAATLAGNLPAFGQGLGSLFDDLQDVFSQDAFASSLPLIGTQLADNVTFFSDLASEFSSQLNIAAGEAATAIAHAIQ